MDSYGLTTKTGRPAGTGARRPVPGRAEHAAGFCLGLTDTRDYPARPGLERFRRRSLDYDSGTLHGRLRFYVRLGQRQDRAGAWDVMVDLPDRGRNGRTLLGRLHTRAICLHCPGWDRHRGRTGAPTGVGEAVLCRPRGAGNWPLYSRLQRRSCDSCRRHGSITEPLRRFLARRTGILGALDCARNGDLAPDSPRRLRQSETTRVFASAATVAQPPLRVPVCSGPF